MDDPFPGAAPRPDPFHLIGFRVNAAPIAWPQQLSNNSAGTGEGPADDNAEQQDEEEEEEDEDEDEPEDEVAAVEEAMDLTPLIEVGEEGVGMGWDAVVGVGMGVDAAVAVAWQ